MKIRYLRLELISILLIREDPEITKQKKQKRERTFDKIKDKQMRNQITEKKQTGIFVFVIY